MNEREAQQIPPESKQEHLSSISQNESAGGEVVHETEDLESLA